VQVNDRVTLDAVEEEEEEEQEEQQDDAAARLDAHEHQALPSVIARVVERFRWRFKVRSAATLICTGLPKYFYFRRV